MKAPDKPAYDELESRCRELERAEEERNTALSMLEAALESTEDGLLVVDRAGRVTKMNRKFIALWRIPDDLLTEREDGAFLDYAAGQLADPEGFLAKVNELYGEPGETSFDEILLADGRVFERYSRPQRLGDRIVGRVWSFRDVTHRKRAEASLREREEQINSIFRSAPVGIGVVVDRVLQKANSRLCEMTGYRESELLGKSARMLYPSQEAFDTVGRVKYAQIEKHGTGTVETCWRRKDGTTIDVLLSSTPVDLADHSRGVTFTALDITDRKRAENALRESEARFRELFHSISDIVYTQDLEGRLLTMNRALCEAFGYSEEELRGRVVSDFMKPEFVDAYRTEYLEALKRDGHHEGVGAYFTRQGDRIYLEYRSAMVYPEDGEPYISGTGRDVTARILSEKENRRLQDQLIQSQKMESVGRLAGGVAHDFNNMLSVILGYGQSAMDELDPSGAAHRNLQEVVRAAKRSAELTKQLLAFARKQIIEPKLLDLNQAVARTMSMLHRLIGEAIQLVWKPAESLWPVKMDPSQIDQILANLCVNAKDAISGVGTITIETGMQTFGRAECTDRPGCLPGDFVRLAVSDDGKGMDRETLAKLFEPFFTTKALGEGTGLGLATIYGIVKQNQGFIDVHSEPGGGSTFTIYLPRCDPQSDAPPAARPAEKPVPKGDETILLVEDEPAILSMVAMMLERRGYIVISAGTPGEALRLAESFPGEIHLLVTDVIMPEMNGQDLADRVVDHYPEVKRLFMSGYAANVISHHDVLDPGVHFIQKPFTMSDLAGKVREALDDNEAGALRA